MSDEVIERLLARIKELEEALRPFVDTLRTSSPYVMDAFELHIKRQDLLNAAKALSK